MKSIINKIINKQKEFSLSNIDSLRLKGISALIIFFILIMCLVIVGRILDNQILVAIIDCFVVALMVLSLYWAYQGKINRAILFSCFLVTTLTFSVSYFELLNPILHMPQLVLVCVTWILLFKRKQRILYTIICIILICLVFSSLSFNAAESGAFLFQISGFIGFYFFIAHHLELSSTNLENSISEKQNLNERLEAQNKELETFSHIMAHDLKSPLRTINSFVGLIKKREKFENEKSYEYFDFIEKSANQMQQIINELLMLQSINSKKLELNRVVFDDIINPIISQYHLDIQANKIKIIVDQVPDIYGSKTLLDTLFRNLINNGLKYQPLENTHIPTIHITGKKNERSVEIILSDNGIGIKEEFLDQIFEPFKRLHNESEYSGTGLGLSICKRVMEKQNGRITIFKSTDKGTSFLLEFQNPTANRVDGPTSDN